LCFRGERNPEIDKAELEKRDVLLILSGVVYSLPGDLDGGFYKLGTYPQGSG